MAEFIRARMSMASPATAKRERSIRGLSGSVGGARDLEGLGNEWVD